MKLATIVPLFFISICCHAQFRSKTDSSSTTRLPATRTRQIQVYHMISGGGSNVVVGTSNMVISPMESKIAALENREIEALKKRDVIALTALWARDFSGEDVSTQGVVTSDNSLPYYAFLSRIVESVSTTDSTAFTSGKERFQLLGNGSQKMEMQERKFSHIWSKKDDIWKLTSKVHTKE